MRLSSNSSWDESTQSSLAYVIFSYLLSNDNKLEISGQIDDVTDGVYFVAADSSSKSTRHKLEKRSLGKVIFSQTPVCPQGRGCYDVTSCYGQHPPPGQHHTPGQYHTPWTVPHPLDSTTPLPVNKRAVRILRSICFLVFN